MFRAIKWLWLISIGILVVSPVAALDVSVKYVARQDGSSDLEGGGYFYCIVMGARHAKDIEATVEIRDVSGLLLSQFHPEVKTNILPVPEEALTTVVMWHSFTFRTDLEDLSNSWVQVNINGNQLNVTDEDDAAARAEISREGAILIEQVLGKVRTVGPVGKGEAGGGAGQAPITQPPAE